MTLTIAVIGANGFVGGAICEEILKRDEFKLIRVVRGEDISKKTNGADIIIHSANPSKRYFAEINPVIDFMESVEKTYGIKQLINNKKMILISSISSRTQLDTVYGRHRRACELIVNERENLIIRLGPMYGERKHVGALYDIVNNKDVYVSEETKYSFVDIRYNAKKILDLSGERGIFELGARNYIKLGELKNLLQSTSNFVGTDDTQVPINPQSDAPDARDVIPLAMALKRGINA